MAKTRRVTAREYLHALWSVGGQSITPLYLERLAAVEAEARDREALRLARRLYRKSLNIRGLVGQHLEAAAVEFRAEIRQRKAKRRKEKG